MILTCIQLSAQDKIKPAKDKSTKLYGYRNKANEWVIPPTFKDAWQFKEGAAEVEMETGRGVIGLDGSFIIPAVYEKVSLQKRKGLVDVRQDGAWGLYDYEGHLLYEPAFNSSLSFSSEGYAVADLKATRMKGIVDLNGNVVLPFNYHYLHSSSSGYCALNRKMRVVRITSDFKREIDDNDPASATWFPAVYDTRGDIVRAIAYGHRGIGVRFYQNMAFWTTEPVSPRGYMTVSLMPALDLAWAGPESFLRLEPVVTEDNGVFEHEGRSYTVAAVMYAVDGTPTVVSRSGYISMEASEGVFYVNEAGRTMFLCQDVNMPLGVVRADVNSCRQVDPSHLESALGLSRSDLRKMNDRWDRTQIHTDVELVDLAGCQSYTQILPADREMDAVAREMEDRYIMLRRRFRQDEVFTLGHVHEEPEMLRVEVAPGLMAHYRDDFGHSFTLSCDEPVRWGVDGRRYVKIDPLPYKLSYSESKNPASVRGIVYESRYGLVGVNFAVSLYEYDGRFVRTVAVVRDVRIAAAGLLVLGGLDWVFTLLPPSKEGSYMVPKTPVPGNSMQVFDRTEPRTDSRPSTPVPGSPANPVPQGQPRSSVTSR